MIRNYFKIAFRNFYKQRSFTLLNVIGLSLGMVASMLILQYVKYERSFDTFHSKAKDIYRVQYNGWQGGKLRFECAAAVPAVGPALKNNFPSLRFTAKEVVIQGNKILLEYYATLDGKHRTSVIEKFEFQDELITKSNVFYGSEETI